MAFGGGLTMDQVKIILRSFEKKLNSKLAFLDSNAITIGKTRIVGGTLWTNVPEEAQDTVQNGMNDYLRIIIGDKEEKDKHLSTENVVDAIRTGSRSYTVRDAINIHIVSFIYSFIYKLVHHGTN